MIATLALKSVRGRRTIRGRKGGVASFSDTISSAVEMEAKEVVNNRE